MPPMTNDVLKKTNWKMYLVDLCTATNDEENQLEDDD